MAAKNYSKVGLGRTTDTDSGADYDGRTVNNTPGSGCQGAMPQRPIPGPESTGGPASMKKALARKSTSGSGPGLPNKGTSYPGSR